MLAFETGSMESGKVQRRARILERARKAAGVVQLSGHQLQCRADEGGLTGKLCQQVVSASMFCSLNAQAFEATILWTPRKRWMTQKALLGWKCSDPVHFCDPITIKLKSKFKSLEETAERKKKKNEARRLRK